MVDPSYCTNEFGFMFETCETPRADYFHCDTGLRVEYTGLLRKGDKVHGLRFGSRDSAVLGFAPQTMRTLATYLSRLADAIDKNSD